MAAQRLDLGSARRRNRALSPDPGPARLRRAAALRNELVSTPEQAHLRAQLAWDLLKSQLFGATLPPDPRLETLVPAAVNELAEIYRADKSIGDLPTTMPHLAELAAWAVHVRVAAQEMPALARGIRADRIDGANPRSNGELLLAEQEKLLDRLTLRLDRGTEAHDLTAEDLSDATAALKAFDRAGVGRESLLQEGTSDQMIRTATSTAAVAVTLIDSDASGFSAAKPVTRSLRGGMLLPYWVITGLSAGGVLQPRAGPAGPIHRVSPAGPVAVRGPARVGFRCSGRTGRQRPAGRLRLRGPAHGHPATRGGPAVPGYPAGRLCRGDRQ